MPQLPQPAHGFHPPEDLLGRVNFWREKSHVQRSQRFRRLHPPYALIIALWHRFRGDPRVRGAPLSRPALIARVLPIEKKFFALATRHVNAANADVSNLARALFVHHAHFFTFVHEEGVEPTNNVAERALRAAVQWRKIMFGNRSVEGELAVARLLTVTRTCQLQQLNVLAYLTAAICCYRRGQAVASLLPKRLTP